MHRQTPLTSAFTGYVSGGARALIDTIDDGKLMQQMKGLMMGESREGVESPQNYGFSSVVRAATKDASGLIQDCAEGFMSYFGGCRTSNFCAIMDDRRYRPLGLKQGENTQYDDLGQMTLLRRTGLYLLSLDGPDDSQQSSSSGGGGSSTAGVLDSSGGSGGSGQTVNRFVSVRHVQKEKQQRPQRGSAAQGQGGGQSQQSQQSQQDFQHEGQSVNNEMRVSAARIEFQSGGNVVGYYDKQSATWAFIGKVKLGDENASHPVYGVNNGKGMTSDPNAVDAVLINAPNPGPPTSLDNAPLLARIDALERKIAELESRISNA